ncbi:DUF3168 domain-containing protein [Maricaulis sp.]|uniref:DUF3168 domain-containing protein n=1 Tax=Maricaulis sp. TaxID=1486257 RepID=UPI0025C34CC9|nr:DUF3168 domain-containing protein [Maricaulis sp.]
MSGVVEALQAALAAQFADTPQIALLLGDPLRLHASRDHRAAFPHASWGRAEISEKGGDGVRLAEVRLGLDVWYRDGDPGPVLEALADAVHALAADPDLPEPVLPDPWRLVTLTPVYRDVFTTPERRMKRGVLRVKAVAGRDHPIDEGDLP